MTSRPPVRRAPPRTRADLRREDGFALVAALGVAVVAMLLALTVMAVAVRGAQTTGTGRDRSQASAAAEAGLSTTAAVLGSLTVSSAGTRWCSTSTTSPVPLSPTSAYEAVVTFYGALADVGDTTKATDCSLAGTVASYAQVVTSGRASTGSGVVQVQHLQAVLRLGGGTGSASSGTSPPSSTSPSSSTSPATGPGLSGRYGVLGNTVDLTQASFATLEAGSTGLVVGVAAGAGTCGDYLQVHADVVVSAASFSTGSFCHVSGSVRAPTGVAVGSYSTVDGGVVTKPGMLVTRGAFASTGPVTYSAEDPAWDPSAQLPRITDGLEAWRARGFTTQPWTGSCTVASFGSRTLAQTGPTIYDTRSACPSGLVLQDYAQLTVKGGDVVLLVAGFTAGSYADVTTDSTARRTWLVVPAAATGPACAAPGNITFKDFSGSQDGAGLFLYSPCSVSLGQYVTVTGQVWGGAVRITGYGQVTFKDLGIPSAGGGTTVVSETMGTSS